MHLFYPLTSRLLARTTISRLVLLLLICIFPTKNIFAQAWNELVKVVASDRSSNDEYGYSVSISGDYAIVGARNSAKDANGSNSLSKAGSAYILKRSNNDWVQIKKLEASDRAEEDLFGYSVAISGDYAIVSAPWEDEDAGGNNTLSKAGSVYIFKKDVGGTDNWGQLKKIVSSDRTAGDQFGYSVALSGNYAIVGVPFNDNNAFTNNGAAYIFEASFGGADNWGERKKIVAVDRLDNDWFGYSVAIHGTYAVVGAPLEDEDENLGIPISEAGSAYIFEKDQDSVDNWGQFQKIVSSDRDANDMFGKAVTINGLHIAVGTETDKEDADGDNTLNNSGSVYLYKWNVNKYDMYKKIVAPTRDADDYFGFSLALTSDHLFVGARGEDEDNNEENTLSNAGSVFVYGKDYDGNDSWNFVKKINNSDRDENDQFGSSVAATDDYIIVGARFEEDDKNSENSLTAAGSVYIIGHGEFSDVKYQNTVIANGDNTPSEDEGTDFGTTYINETSTRTYYITNSGTGPIKILENIGIVISGVNSSNFSVVSFTSSVMPGSSGSITISFTPTDQAGFNATVTINHDDVDDPPWIFDVKGLGQPRPEPLLQVNTGGEVDEGGTLTLSDQHLKSIDQDGPSYSLIYNITELPKFGSLIKNGSLLKSTEIQTNSFTQNDIANGKVQYVNNGEESSEDSFIFFVSDTDGYQTEEYTFSITINGINDPPVFTGVPNFTINEDENFSITMNSLFSYVDDPDDPDSLLSFSISRTCENITLSNEENFCHICGIENWFGTTELKLTVSDSSTTIDTTFSLTILPVNDLPVIEGLPSSLLIMNGNIETIDLNGKATDVETPDSLLTYSFTATPDSVNLNYNSETNEINVSVKGSFSGIIELTVIVTDEDGGTDETTITITVTPDPTSIEGLNGLPVEYELAQNYPNPFNPSTIIRYAIPAVGDAYHASRNVSLKIFDILGGEVATLVNEQQAPGYYERTWDASNLSSGIYFYVLRAGTYVESRKMILMK